MGRSIVAVMPGPLGAGAIRWGSVGPLLLVAAAIMGSPGPATVSLVAAGSAFGVRRSLPYLVGVVVGTTLVVVAVATGITAALLAIPAIKPLLIGTSVLYILWLAYHVATARPLAEPPSISNAPALAGGVTLGVANPKAWVAIAAVFASAHLTDVATSDAVAKTVVLTAMIFVICATWLVAGTLLTALLRDPQPARIINITLAVALVGAAALAVLR